MYLQTGGAQGAAPTPVVLTAPEGASVVIPDTHSLFDAEFARDGRDLVISNPGAPELRISGYFHPAQPADLQSPDGAVLRGDLAARLAGPEAPGQYAQAGLPQGADPIGQVETVGGEASVQRTDGVREPLTVGTKIFLDDVIETGSGGTLSVTFVDGTIFTLSPGSRMIIDELVYTPAGQSNSGSFNLIQGGFVFIAGQVARTGGMDVNTPAATMGIRGTTVLAEIETRGGVSTAEITLTPDPDGQVGRVAIFDLGGNLITTITDTSTKWIVSTLEGDTREVARSAEDAQADNVLIAEAVAAYDSAQARFQSGGSFIELNTLRGNAPNPSGPDEEDGGVDLDSIDDPLAPELSPEDAPEQSPQRPTLDEGRNQLDPEPEQRTIVVTGFEDLNEDSRIAGALNPDPARASLTLQSLPANGTVTIGPGGTFVYLPDPDFNGSDEFTYVLTDAEGVVEVGTVKITVLPVNDAPQIGDQRIAGVEDTVVTGQAQGRDVDGDALVYSLAGAAAHGTVSVAQDGSWTYRPEADFAGSDSFRIAVADGAGGLAAQVVTVAVSGSPDAPVVTSALADARGRLIEGAAREVSGKLTASDADAGATLAWSGSTAGAWGAFVIAADGAWSYQAGAAAESLAAGQTVTERFTATVTDDQGATATQVVTVTVTGTNDGPIADALNATFAQDSVLSGTLVARDADSGDTLTFAQGATAPAHGTVTIQPDGAFTYTPQPGFSGLDRFSFLVTDASGATSEAQATLAVNAVPTKASNGQTVTLDIRFDPDPGVAPAGSLVASVSELDAGNVNLVIALDRSGSVGAANWQTAIDDVADALDKLAARFVGAETKVTVQVIPYASTASVAGTFDLTDPDLITTVRNLPFTGGGTNWTAALDRTESFLDGQSAGDLNYLYFVSDGEPSNASWRAVFDRLTDSAAKGYELQVEAFGIGGKVDLATLGLMDTTPTILSGADELAQAFGATPLFSAQLVDLSVTMIVDGIDLGQIADETAAGLETSGFTTRLALAEIPGFVDLLGRENLVTATAGFDLDGDPDTVEFQLASSQLFTRAASAQTLTGTDGSDLLFGSDRNDVLNGGEGNDILLGFGGDDRLRTGGGLDVVRAGAGDDRIIVDRSDAPDGAAQESLRGGSGRDVLAVAFGGDLNDRLLDLVDLRGVEAVDMDNGKANALSLSLEDVLAFSNEADTLLETLLGEPLPESLTVIGDAKDSLELVAGETGAFVDTGTSVTDPDGNSLSVFRYVKGSEVLATLAVDADVTVTLQPVG